MIGKVKILNKNVLSQWKTLNRIYFFTLLLLFYEFRLFVNAIMRYSCRDGVKFITYRCYQRCRVSGGLVTEAANLHATTGYHWLPKATDGNHW